jgi:hypothetical protein
VSVSGKVPAPRLGASCLTHSRNGAGSDPRPAWAPRRVTLELWQRVGPTLAMDARHERPLVEGCQRAGDSIAVGDVHCLRFLESGEQFSCWHGVVPLTL